MPIFCQKKINFLKITLQSCPNLVHVNIIFIYLYTLDGVKTIFYLAVILRVHHFWEMVSFVGAVRLKYLFNGKGQRYHIFPPGKIYNLPLF